MIRTVAEFLLQLKDVEAAKLDAVKLTHGPTIGDMYEGLSKDLLSRAIPEELGLRLVSGFIVDGIGGMSGQIDCMLVRGQGEQVPYTSSYFWHAKDVIAVLEIKKNLFGDELADDFAKLRMVKKLESNYRSTLHGQHDKIDVESGLRTFEQTTGRVRPARDKVDSLSELDWLIYHHVVFEELSVIRIIFGYHGFHTERGFRQSFFNLLQKNQNKPGWGITSLPHLIVSGGYSMVKANGQPYIGRVVDNAWPCYSSSAANPLRFVLELIWTRLDREFSIGGLWGDDLDVEVFHPYLMARSAVQENGHLGWSYEYVDLSERQLTGSRTSAPWEPTILTEHQYVVLGLLLQGYQISPHDSDVSRRLKQEGVRIDQFWKDLIDTRLVGVDGDELQLLTDQLMVVKMPNGQIYGADNRAGHMVRWIAAQEEPDNKEDHGKEG
jgi:hypothetical protein